jgi:hypothetical protein
MGAAAWRAAGSFGQNGVQKHQRSAFAKCDLSHRPKTKSPEPLGGRAESRFIERFNDPGEIR